MSYRFMRVIVCFDLPVLTSEERKEYRRFRKFLIKSGFMMMQESVYCKLAVNSSAAETIVNNIKRNKPKSGLVQSLKFTEKQYSKMEYVVGDSKSSVIDSDQRIVIL